MVISVLVVDDSSFFRGRITEVLNASAELNVVGEAQDGVEAVEKARKLNPDVITMDYEMPRMDGISAVRKILAHRQVPILMFSSLTYEGARITLDALAAGAMDFLPKSFDVVKQGHDKANRLLVNRVKALANTHVKRVGGPSIHSTAPRESFSSSSSSSSPALLSSHLVSSSARPVSSVSRKPYKLLMIGASTGGPVALQRVLESLPEKFPIPIILVQHMPASFTRAFAERLNHHCKITVQEAENGQRLQPGCALLAPGGMQMMISKGFVKLIAGDDRLQHKPSVDVCFGSAAKSYPGQVLAVVLTGMGFDGREGAKLLKRGHSTVWTQDEASSVVYGMPAAVKKAGLSDETVALNSMSERIKGEVMGGSA